MLQSQREQLVGHSIIEDINILKTASLTDMADIVALSVNPAYQKLIYLLETEYTYECLDITNKTKQDLIKSYYYLKALRDIIIRLKLQPTKFKELIEEAKSRIKLSESQETLEQSLEDQVLETNNLPY